MRENPSEPFTVGEGIWEVMAKWLSSEQEAGSTAHPSDLGTLPQHGVIFNIASSILITSPMLGT